MKRLLVGIVTALTAISFVACGGGGGGGSVTAILSPVNGAVEVALDAAVTAVFSGAITEPADWAAAFTLKKDNAGDTLCTSVTYDGATLTATCAHAAFDKGSGYTTSVSGVTDSGGGAIETVTATFATVDAVVISSIKLVRKDGTELETDGDLPIPRSATIKYTLATALTEEAQRTEFEDAVTVKDAGDSEVAGTYAWAADNLSTVFTPTRNLDFRTEYTITVNTDELPVVNLSSAAGTETKFTTLLPRDIDGDGKDDVIMGAYAYPGGNDDGRAYIFLGSGLTATMGAGDADTMFTGVVGGSDCLGRSVGMAGDVNADGYIDVIVGARWAGASLEGEAYIFHGSATGIPDCAFSAACTPDATITGKLVSDLLGDSVGPAGDVNGDGYDDVIVGASRADIGGAHKKGRAYILHGSATGVGDCDMSDTCIPDATLTGALDNDWFGISVSTAGDVDGDGYADVIVGADVANKAYVFLGSDTAGVEDCDLSGACTPNAIITGAVGSSLGVSVSTAGDIDGDGYADVIVGAGTADGGGSKKGEAYLFKGSANGIGDCDLAGACGNLLSTITGAADDDYLGTSVYTAGDVDGDGTPDLIVGAEGATDGGANRGQAYIFLGSALTANMTPADAEATFTGAVNSSDFGGNAGVSTAGDVDGDGYDDVIVGAQADGAGSRGKVYIFDGSASGMNDCNLGDGCNAANAFTGEDTNEFLGVVR